MIELFFLCKARRQIRSIVDRILHRNISYDIRRTQWFRGSYQFCVIFRYGSIDGGDTAERPHRTEYAKAYDAGCFGHKM